MELTTRTDIIYNDAAAVATTTTTTIIITTTGYDDTNHDNITKIKKNNYQHTNTNAHDVHNGSEITDNCYPCFLVLYLSYKVIFFNYAFQYSTDYTADFFLC